MARGDVWIGVGGVRHQPAAGWGGEAEGFDLGAQVQAQQQHLVTLGAGLMV